MIKFDLNMFAIWAGKSDEPIDQWMKYTDGIENPKKNPPIEKDLGWFPDIDLFGIHISENDEVVPIEKLIEGAVIYSRETEEKVIEQARRLGIYEGNRLYYYLCAEFIPEYPHKQYNGLTFIGNFKDDRPRF